MGTVSPKGGSTETTGDIPAKQGKDRVNQGASLWILSDTFYGDAKPSTRRNFGFVNFLERVCSRANVRFVRYF
jgi:hypothetical protein